MKEMDYVREEAASQRESSDNLWWGGDQERGEVGFAANVGHVNHVGWR